MRDGVRLSLRHWSYVYGRIRGDNNLIQLLNFDNFRCVSLACAGSRCAYSRPRSPRREITRHRLTWLKEEMSISQNASYGSLKLKLRLRQVILDQIRVALTGKHVRSILLSLTLVSAATIGLIGLSQIAELPHVSIVYLIPVLISATRWGILPAVLAALASMAAAAFFFYPPIYSLQVHSPLQLLDLVLFLFVAIVTGQLANNVRHHVAAAHQRESEVRALYAFSRQLAIASSASEIHAAIESHLSGALDRRVVLFETMSEGNQLNSQRDVNQVPAIVRDAISKAMNGVDGRDAGTIIDDETGDSWLIRTVSQQTPTFGLLAIDIGQVSQDALGAIRRHIDGVLADATATIERLDIARALGEARMRAESETFRDALIGSVSHELRTPLASIVGSTYLLASAPGVQQDARLKTLADDVCCEAERLNDDIQNLLDASRITSEGVRPHLQWADIADIINAAVERQQRRLSSHHLELNIPEELPLVQVDPVLIEQALGQIIDNAVKYSPTGSLIRVSAAGGSGNNAIAVTDQGAGLAGEERIRIWDRFYRSPRHHATPGSGLGLWVARAFVLASGGRIEATSLGIGQGTTVTIQLPAPRPTTADDVGSPDD
jgi:two-component system sensor histidine kinase KdpD